MALIALLCVFVIVLFVLLVELLVWAIVILWKCIWEELTGR